LTKDDNDVWICASDCKDSGAFYFINEKLDKECAPESDLINGCKFLDSDDNTVHRLPADDTVVTNLAYHIVDTNDSSKRICQSTCDAGYYQDVNLLCLLNCQASNLFRERAKVIGANGVNISQADNYFKCSVDKCNSDLFFRQESPSSDNICMDGCAALGTDTYSLTSSTIRTNNL
jgi:hypothetical protein